MDVHITREILAYLYSPEFMFVVMVLCATVLTAKLIKRK